MKLRIPILLLLLLIVYPCVLAQSSNDFLYGASKVYSTDQTQMGRDIIAIEEKYGTSSPLVLMVPKEDRKKEVAFNEALKKLEFVTSVISYVNTVGEAIPEDYVPSGQLSQLYSEHYSRFVLTLDTEEGKPDWFEKIGQLRTLMTDCYGDEALMAGDLASTADLKTTIVQDNTKVNAMAIGFVFLILVVNFRSLIIPIILTVVIEASIWINLAVPYFTSETLHYIAYLIISSVQLGATIDYAILFTSRYQELRSELPRKAAGKECIRVCFLSVLTSAGILTIAGILLGIVSTNLVLSQLGTLVGRGAVISFLLVFTVLPALLVIFDRVVVKKGGKS